MIQQFSSINTITALDGLQLNWECHSYTILLYITEQTTGLAETICSSMACLVSYNSHKLWEKTHKKTFPATDTSYLLKKHSKCECSVMTAGHRYVVHLNTEANEVKIWLRMWVPFRTIDYNGRRRCLECVTKCVRGFVWHHQLECAFNGIAACDVSLR